MKRGPSYELVVEQTEKRYQVEVIPRCGRSQTFYVVPRYFGWAVKIHPESGSHFSTHKDFIDACLAANRKARAYGRAWSTPIRKTVAA